MKFQAGEYTRSYCLIVKEEVLFDVGCKTCRFFKFDEWEFGFFLTCGRSAGCGMNMWKNWKPSVWLLVQDEVEL